MLHITEDTPADMLAGSMELIIHLPSGKTVKMFAERSTPMMDMLVQITTNNHLQITNYVLQPLQTSSDPDQSEKILTYYPNTPIGTLDTQHIRVVSKTRVLPSTRTLTPGHQPFESTFRLKVHLPRNQLYVTRVSRNVLIEDIMRKVCEEKDLDPKKYEVRHPGNLTEVLDPKLTLNDYMVTEIHLMIVNSKTQTFTSNDVICLKQDTGRKQAAKTGGVFNLIFKKNKSNTGSGPFSAAIHSIFTTRKENHRTNHVTTTPTPTPPKPDVDRTDAVPKPPQRKRRPAPKPPSRCGEKTATQPDYDRVEMRIKSPDEAATATSETNLTICHSRHSSDSSGYHETSFLSDQCNTSLPRMAARLKEGKLGKRHTGDFGGGGRIAMTERSRSTPSLVFPGRKKKAAPSPPTQPQNSTLSPPNLEQPSPVVVASLPSRTESPGTDSNETTEHPIQPSTLKTQTEDVVDSMELPPESNHNEKIEEFTESCVYEKFPTDSGNSSDISEKSKMDYEDLEPNDQIWQLPSPPKAFKDSEALYNQSEQTEMDQNTVIVPELITKLRVLEEEQEKNEDRIEELKGLEEDREKNEEKLKDLEEEQENLDEDQPIYNKLSLENLEKRRTLVYNRELATSLKPTGKQDSVLKKYQSDLELSGKLNEFIDMLEDIRRNNEKNRRSTTQSTLPNFKITTYEEPKQIKVFEDDTIRSNSNLNRAQSLQKIYNENNLVKIGGDGDTSRSRRPMKRSESFSTDFNGWISTNPVTRSKSQCALKRNGGVVEGMSKTGSLYDISGLQSLGVMKRIQNKLNSPAKPTESTSLSIETNHRTTRTTDEEPARHYTNPASINICTWSERSRLPATTEQKTKPQTNFNQTLRISINEPELTNIEKNCNIIKIGGDVQTESDLHVSRIPVVRSVELKKNLESFENFKKTTQVKTIRSQMALPNIEYTTNQNVPFTTFNLRHRNNELCKRSSMPRIQLDPRAELLRSIQEFGGKKGLRTIKMP